MYEAMNVPRNFEVTTSDSAPETLSKILKTLVAE